MEFRYKENGTLRLLVETTTTEMVRMFSPGKTILATAFRLPFTVEKSIRKSIKNIGEGSGILGRLAVT